MNEERNLRLMLRLCRKMTALAKKLDPNDPELIDIEKTLNEVEDVVDEITRLDPDEDDGQL